MYYSNNYSCVSSAGYQGGIQENVLYNNIITAVNKIKLEVYFKIWPWLCFLLNITSYIHKKISFYSTHKFNLHRAHLKNTRRG
jgi:hypothetical protein